MDSTAFHSGRRPGRADSFARRLARRLRSWVDADAPVDPAADPDRVEWARITPFLLLHLSLPALAWAGVSPFALAWAGGLYLLRMFAITGFYHRYFSHRSFRAGRAVQFAGALLGNLAAQRGPLWWAAHHRHHHRHSDGPADAHSPRRGWWWSHVAWFTTPRHHGLRRELVADWLRFPELRWLDRYCSLAPLALFAGSWALGAVLGRARPEWGVDGFQLLAWTGVSTVLLFHATAAINSLAHLVGRRAYATGDDSRNSLWLALLTLGEGWHNNHHYYPHSARQGFRAREIDLTWWGLKVLAALGLVRGLKPVPARVLAARGAAEPGAGRRAAEGGR